MKRKREADHSKIKKLHVKAVPVPLANKHDPVPHEILPEHESTWGIIAPKGSGKTTLLCNMLAFYKGYFNTIIIISPTVRNDDKWDWVKTQPLLGENKKLKKALAAIKAKKERDQGDNPVVAKAPKEFRDNDENMSERPVEKFDPYIPEDCFISEYTEADFEKIIADQDHVIAYLKKHGYSKHTANKLLIILDDLVGSALFSRAQKNPFKMANTNHRHLSLSMWMITQAYTEIPKTIRTNFTVVILFEIFSEGEIKTIMEEYPMGMKKNQWMEAYHYCTKDDHAFLNYDIKRPKALRVMKNFTEVVFFKDEEEKFNI